MRDKSAMSARRILGLEQTFNCSPRGKPWGNNRAQNGEGHANECSYTREARGSPRGKDDSRSSKAYIAGFLDGDGSHHGPARTPPGGKRFGFRVRMLGQSHPAASDTTWRGFATNLATARCARTASAGSGWSRTSPRSTALLREIRPYMRVKAQQVDLALRSWSTGSTPSTICDKQAEWADTLAALNVRSRGRTLQNRAAMIQGFVSRND